jgi:hypothetical protein
MGEEENRGWIGRSTWSYLYGRVFGPSEDKHLINGDGCWFWMISGMKCQYFENKIKM